MYSSYFMFSSVRWSTFSRSPFGVNINKALHKKFSLEIFFFNQFTACLSPPAEYSQKKYRMQRRAVFILWFYLILPGDFTLFLYFPDTIFFYWIAV